MDKIADAFSLIRNGANIKQGLDDSGYPITRIETISNRTVDRDKMGYAGITDITKYSDYVLQDGDILMSHINSETHLGKVAHYEKYEGETIIHGMNLLCLRPNKNLVDSRYAFYYLSSEAFLHQIPRITKKSVNQASFNVAALKELTFPISSMEVQQPVADILDKANELIALRKEQLAKLDELVKARFVEMFGDPERNTLSWKEEELSEHLTVIGGYAFKSEQFSEEGITVLRIGNINSGFFKPVNLVYWEDDNTLNRYKMYPGDLAMSLTGTVGKDDYGNVCILGNDYDVYYLNQRNAKLELQDIAKLKSNVPLTAEDVQALEKALWNEVGTKQDYEAEYGQKPLGEFVREIVGLDMNAAKEAFAQYLNDASLDSRQIYFVNQIVEYIVHNGMMKDLSVLQEAPFTDHGSIVEVFTDLTVWMGIRNTIEKINSNAVA